MRPDIAVDMAQLGFAPRHILVHIAWRVTSRCMGAFPVRMTLSISENGSRCIIGCFLPSILPGLARARQLDGLWMRTELIMGAWLVHKRRFLRVFSRFVTSSALFGSYVRTTVRLVGLVGPGPAALSLGPSGFVASTCENVACVGWLAGATVRFDRPGSSCRHGGRT